jgi:hypothetical protein
MKPVRTSIVTAAAIAAALAAGVTGVALADSTATPTPAPSASASDKADRTAPDELKRRHGGRPGLALMGRGAVHGEFVIKDADGGFRTVLSQRGEATEVSDDEITVRSEDGFTTTYAVTDETLVNATRGGIADIEKGEDVNVVATKVGNKATAIRIGDLSAHKQLRERFGMDGSGKGA